jgi:hypothetical protein
MSRIRGPYVRFCERDGASLICSPHPTRLIKTSILSPWASIVIKTSVQCQRTLVKVEVCLYPYSRICGRMGGQ